MLQQTRVEVVVPYYRRFVERWPTLEALAAASDAEVFAAWSGLGYYARCRNLLAAARATLDQHGGLPASLADLRALPGFGPYTAGAVASIAFGIPAAAVDGNATRVLARIFALRGDPAGHRHREHVWELARALAGEGRGGEPSSPGDWTQALMELGATVCGRRPDCRRCPLAALCAAHAAGLTAGIPRARRRPRRKRLVLACAIVRRGDRILLARQPRGGLFAGLLALPCAELPDGTDGQPAIRQALRSLGLRVRTGVELASVERILTHRHLQLRAFACRVLSAGPARAVSPGGELRWVRVAELDGAGLPAAMKALLDALPATARGRTGSTRLAFSARVV